MDDVLIEEFEFRIFNLNKELLSVWFKEPSIIGELLFSKLMDVNESNLFELLFDGLSLSASNDEVRRFLACTFKCRVIISFLHAAYEHFGCGQE